MGYIADHAAEPSKLRFRLLQIAFDPDPFFVTDCPIGIEWNGESWLPRGLRVGSITNSAQGQSCTIEVEDVDNSLFVLLDASNGGEEMPIAVFMAEFALDSSSAVPDDVTQSFAGAIQTATKAMDGGIDRVELWCGPPKQTTGTDFPTRLISTLVRTI